MSLWFWILGIVSFLSGWSACSLWSDRAESKAESQRDTELARMHFRLLAKTEDVRPELVPDELIDILSRHTDAGAALAEILARYRQILVQQSIMAYQSDPKPRSEGPEG